MKKYFLSRRNKSLFLYLYNIDVVYYVIFNLWVRQTNTQKYEYLLFSE